MSTPHDHHFIPAFYLKNWAKGSPPKLIEYSIKYGKIVAKPIGPDGTGYEYDLYAFNELPPDLAQFIEKRFFGYVDRTASLALSYHLNPPGRAAWTPEIVSAWARFISTLLTRHPDTMLELRRAIKQAMKIGGVELQQNYENSRRAGDPATLDDYFAKLDPLAPIKIQMELLISLFDDEISGQKMIDMQWSVLDLSAAKFRFLTSDRPVVFDNLDKPDGLLAMPISPTKLFVAVNHQHILDQLRRKPPNEIVARTNEVVAWRARKYVWADDLSQRRFVENHMSKKMEQLPLLRALAALSENPLEPIPNSSG